MAEEVIDHHAADRVAKARIERSRADSSEAKCGIWWFDISWEQEEVNKQ